VKFPRLFVLLKVNGKNILLLNKIIQLLLQITGRFDLNAASFRCLNINCKYNKEPVLASMRDYVLTGLWPGSPTRSCTLFSKSVLIKWFHLKHKTPSTAPMKYIEVLKKMSLESGRVGPIVILYDILNKVFLLMKCFYSEWYNQTRNV
jgi:hypothetical protein